MSNAHGNASNKNVELGGRDTFKRFKHGITGYILGERRVDGGWHIAMSYQLHIALCTLPELSQATRLKIAEAYELLFAVHHALRNPLPPRTGMAGLDKKEIFCALAKTLPIATDVACFLSTQNLGS